MGTEGNMLRCGDYLHRTFVRSLKRVEILAEKYERDASFEESGVRELQP